MSDTDSHNESSRRGQAFLGQYGISAEGIRSCVPAIHPNAFPMHMGLDAECLFVDSGVPGRRLFLKLYEAELPQFDFYRAIDAAKRAGSLQIAPQIVAHDAPLRAALFETPGPRSRMGMLTDLIDEDLQRATIEKLRRWHAGAPLQHRAPVFELLPGLIEQIEQQAPWLVDLAIPRWRMLVDWTRRVADALAASCTGLSPVHGEMFISNILILPDRSVLLVDFDYAADGDPASDLGALCLELCELEEDYGNIVEMYAGEADPALLARAKLSALLEDFRWGCWALLRHVASPRRDQINFLVYGQHRLRRCESHLRDWNVDALLRQLTVIA
jgi:thiamine kinase-like enzyme